MELFCTNGFSSPRGIEKNLVSVSCAYGKKFYFKDSLYNFDEFICRRHPSHTVQRRRSSTCFNNGTLVDVGYKVGKRFLNVMTICHDPKAEQSFYSKYILTPANVAAQQGFKRPKFSQGDFFPGKDINFLYSRNQQREAISETINSDSWANKLVQEKGDVFLSRGE